MDALTLPPTDHPRYESRSNKLRKLPVSQRWMAVLSYHLAGKHIDEISALTGYTVGTIRVILANERVNELRQLLLQSTQQEFEALFGTITNKIREMLDNKDQCVDAINLWIKMHGRNGANKQAAPVNNFTAEDIVFNILNNNNNSNKGNPPQPPPSLVDRGTRDE